jgi:hypothetical protein
MFHMWAFPLLVIQRVCCSYKMPFIFMLAAEINLYITLSKYTMVRFSQGTCYIQKAEPNGRTESHHTVVTRDPLDMDCDHHH